MEPIISPAWIYLINVADKIYGLSIFAFGISLFILASVYIDVIEFNGQGLEEKKRRCMKICAVIMIVFTFVLVLIPDKRTTYEMLAASIITPDNISGGEEHLIDLITKTVSAINNTAK